MSLLLNPLLAREGGGGGFRGGGGANAGRRAGGPPVGGAPRANPGPAHSINTGPSHVSGGIHNVAPMHDHPGGIGGNHFGENRRAVYGGHFAGNIHQPGPHWNNYHQAFVGNHPIHLAPVGYRPSYYYHPWYHGPWGGHAWGWGWGFGPGLTFGLAGVGIDVGAGWGYPVYYGAYGPYGYWGRPLGWGFGGWGLGTTVYVSGYYPYYNPYYYLPAGYPTVVYDYSRPIQPIAQAPVGTLAASRSSSPASSTVYDGSSPTSTTPLGTPLGVPPFENREFDMARESFKRGDYRASLQDIDVSIRKNPNDAVMHEFRSLTLFAMRDFRQSAAVAHSLLAVGPGWDYTTMNSLYPDPFVYSEQLQRLEEYVKEHPRAADAHFLLAYHEMIGSRKEAAIAELQQVVKLMPNDQLAGELLLMVQGPKHASSSNSQNKSPNSLPSDPDSIPPKPSGPASPDLPPIDKVALLGNWGVSRDDGSKFRVTLNSDGIFQWKFSAANQKGEEFSGNYTIDGPMLVLERKEGGALAGIVTFDGDDKMNFKLVGGPPEDHGLDFRRF